MPYIYKITNTINGKVYIGQTVKKPSERFREHKYLASHPELDHRGKLHAAMRKYGFDKFCIETVEECDVNLLDEREIYWISWYGSFENGYNCTLGGGQGRKLVCGDFSRLWESGMTISEIARSTGSDRKTVSSRLADGGITREDIDTRAKEHASFRMSKVVYQYDLDGNFIAEYDSLPAAAKATGINISCIRGVITKQHQTAGNFQWKRHKADNVGKSSRVVDSTKKPIHKYSLDGEYLASYPSLNKARLAVGLGSTVTIRRVLCGDAWQTAGYRWNMTKVKNLNELESVV